MLIRIKLQPKKNYKVQKKNSKHILSPIPLFNNTPHENQIALDKFNDGSSDNDTLFIL